MINELYSHLWTNIHRTGLGPVRLTESYYLTKEDLRCFNNAFFLQLSIPLEIAHTTSNQSLKQAWGHISMVCDHVRSAINIERYLKLLDEADSILLSVISTEVPGFKVQLLLSKLRSMFRSSWPELSRHMMYLIGRVFLADTSAHNIRNLRTFFKCMSKLRIDRSDLLESLYSEYRYSEFLAESETFSQKNGTSSYKDIVRHARLHLVGIISNFHVDLSTCQHGPGAVSDPSIKSLISKFANMRFDSRISRMLHVSQASSMNEYMPTCMPEEDRISRVIYVPKTWKTLRGISAEPVTLMYFQKSVSIALEASIKLSKFRYIVDINDQSRSRDLALRGSYGGLSTIDLSSASDSVTTQLVKDFFGNTELTRWLLATRSTHTSLNGEIIELSKFAPMGSACCFPVESLVFAAILLSAASRRGLSASYEDLQVYGDDIICPEWLYPYVVSDLTDCGFSVNQEKSFATGFFKESCGMDAWAGHDVTPRKFKDFSFNLSHGSHLTYDHIDRITDTINWLYSANFKTLRSFILDKFLRCSTGDRRISLERYLLFVDRGTGGVFSPYATNFNLKQVYRKDYQRFFYKVHRWRRCQSTSFIEDELLQDEIKYFIWLMKSSSTKEKPDLYTLEWFMDIDSPETYSSRSDRMVCRPTFLDMEL